MPGAALKRIQTLRGQIRGYEQAFYVVGEPTTSHRRYDTLLEELRKLKERHPELIAPDSPAYSPSA